MFFTAFLPLRRIPDLVKIIIADAITFINPFLHAPVKIPLPGYYDSLIGRYYRRHDSAYCVTAEKTADAEITKTEASQ